MSAAPSSFETALIEAVTRAVEDALAKDTRPGTVTIDQAARYLQTSPAAVKALISTGQLKALTVGRRTYIGTKVIDDLLARGATVTLADEATT